MWFSWVEFICFTVGDAILFIFFYYIIFTSWITIMHELLNDDLWGRFSSLYLQQFLVSLCDVWDHHHLALEFIIIIKGHCIFKFILSLWFSCLDIIDLRCGALHFEWTINNLYLISIKKGWKIFKIQRIYLIVKPKNPIYDLSLISQGLKFLFKKKISDLIPKIFKD